MDIFLTIAFALIFARCLGFLFSKIRQPAVIGEIIAGFLLGSYGLGFFSGKSFSILSWSMTLPSMNYTSGEFVIFADIGIIFLLFISGLETSISRMKSVGKASAFVAIGGVIAPLILGILVSIFFGFDWMTSVVVGLILVATSVGVTVRTLMNLHILHTNSGMTILGAAVIDDVIGIVLLAFLLHVDSPLVLTVKIVVFIFLFVYIGLKVMGRVLDLGDRIQLPNAFVSITLAILLIYAFFADRSGITGIIGAFLAGLLIGNTLKHSKKVIDEVKIIGEGFFIPLFFVWVGASVDLVAFAVVDFWFFALAIIIVGIIGKIIGGGLGAKLAGMGTRESLQTGIGMIPRLEMAIATASIAVSHGILEGQAADQILATTILLCTITALITPPLINIISFRGRM